MKVLGHRRESWVALFAALALLLNLFASAWASGAMPFGPQIDAFGNPLCITSHDHDSSVPASDHSRMPDCCTFGCNGAAWAVDMPDAASVTVRWAAVLTTQPTPTPVVRDDAPDYSPGNPRAPPLAA